MIRYFFFCFALLPTIYSSIGPDTLSKKAESVKLSPSEVKRVEQLHYGWYVQAVSSLLGAMGKELYRKMDRNNRRAFVACLDSIEKEHDIKKGAQCLVKAFDGKLLASYPEAISARQYDFVPRKDVNTKQKFPKGLTFKQFSYVKRRIRRNILSLYTNENAKNEAKLEDKSDFPFKVRTVAKAPALKSSSIGKSAVTEIIDLLGGVVRLVKNKTREEQTSLHDSYKKLQQLQDLVSQRKQQDSFKYRMLDMVLGKGNPLRKKKTFQDQVFLSPSIFPFYKDDSGNSVLPLPTLLEAIGTEGKERERLLELIMDASGANEIVEDTLRITKNLMKSDLGKDILEISAVIEESFLAVQKSFTPQQRKDLTRRKYTFLDKEQLHQFYGENGIYNNSLSKLEFDINDYAQMTKEQKEESLKQTVRILAGQPGRNKRAIMVNVLAPTVLAPFAFAPLVQMFNILGPTVLSPNIFSPSIIAPLLLSPPILSPQLFHPLILSPYFLGPNVLSGFIFSPFILSPFVLSPNILTPYVFSPLILSPLVLSAGLASPTVMSGSILSPAVASPPVLAQSALSTAVLSPSFL